MCILSAIDPSSNTFYKPVCVGKLTPTHIEKYLLPNFTDDTLLVTDSHRAYKTVANREGIPLRQIPKGKHKSGAYHLGHINASHRNFKDFMRGYSGVSAKYLDYYVAIFYCCEKNKDLTLKSKPMK